MTPLLSILTGLVLGFAGVGLPTMRTIWSMEGRYIAVFIISVIASLNLFYFTHMVVAKDFFFMAANAIGAGASVSLIAYKRKKNEKPVSVPSVTADDPSS